MTSTRRTVGGNAGGDTRSYNTCLVPAMTDERPLRFLPALLLALLLLASASLSIDVVRTAGGIKGDEATYVAMAFSAAYDGDLQFDRGDLERFWAVYQSGPEGIFLKRGSHIRVAGRSSFPFVRTANWPEDRRDRLFFGKAFAHAVAAAPFVRLAGLNGLLLFNVLLWGACIVCAYVFLRARSPEGYAAGFSVAFFTLSITPVYLVWLTPEIFHVALVCFAGVLWFHRDVAGPGAGRWGAWLRGAGADVTAAVLLGIATFSKPPNLLLVAPAVLFLWSRRLWWQGLLTGLAFGVTVAALFAANALVSGDVNYQGGDRKTFYGRFPFEQADVTFDTVGLSMTTNEIGEDELAQRDELLGGLRHNVGYFFVGRHFGLVPYYVPAVVVMLWWVVQRRQWRFWHAVVLATVGASALVLLVTLPYSWSGGGGPPGNRYFLSLAPMLLFITPALTSVTPVVAAWIGGAALLGHVLVNPFVAAKSPWVHAQASLLRRLPVELTMVNDLPVMLNTGRARVPYGADPVLLLYFLDDHAWMPEPAGIWVRGGARTEIIVRSDQPLSRLSLRLRSNVANRVQVSAGGEAVVADLAPGAPSTVVVAARVVESRGAYACVLSVAPERGAVPVLTEPASRDARLLGVQVQIAGQIGSQGRER
jgi:hypothetical protein